MEEEDECPNCREVTEKVWDERTGDHICTGCGAVLESHMVDLRPEWRHMEEDGDQEHNRVGNPVDPLRDGNHDFFQMGTIIAAPPGSTRHRSTPRNRSTAAAGPSASYDALLLTSTKFPSDSSLKPPRNLHEHLSNVSTLADSLQLAPRLSQRAQDLFSCSHSLPSFRRFSKHAEPLYAACIYLACSEENTHHKLDAITSAAGLEKKEDATTVSKVKRTLKKHVDGLPADSPYKPRPLPATGLTQNELDKERFVRRVGAALKMSGEAMRLSMEMARKAEGTKDWGRNLDTTCAAAILMAVLLVDKGRGLDVYDVADATEVGVDTLRKTYKQFYDFSDFIVPDEVTQKYGALLNPTKLTSRKKQRI